MTPPEHCSRSWSPWQSAVCVILRLHLNWYRVLWNVCKLAEAKLLKTQPTPSLLEQDWDLGDMWMIHLTPPKKTAGTGWSTGSETLCRVIGVTRGTESGAAFRSCQQMRERLGLA